MKCVQYFTDQEIVLHGKQYSQVCLVAHWTGSHLYLGKILFPIIPPTFKNYFLNNLPYPLYLFMDLTNIFCNFFFRLTREVAILTDQCCLHTKLTFLSPSDANLGCPGLGNVTSCHLPLHLQSSWAVLTCIGLCMVVPVLMNISHSVMEGEVSCVPTMWPLPIAKLVFLYSLYPSTTQHSIMVVL